MASVADSRRPPTRSPAMSEPAPSRNGLNRLMARVLRTPGLQRWVGRSIAMISFTGLHTGRVYSTPVGYARIGSRVVILTRRSRRWWRNLVPTAPIQLRLAGRIHHGRASAHIGRREDLDLVSDFLDRRPLDARGYGVPTGSDGRPDSKTIQALLPNLVVISVDLNDPAPR